MTNCERHSHGGKCVASVFLIPVSDERQSKRVFKRRVKWDEKAAPGFTVLISSYSSLEVLAAV